MLQFMGSQRVGHDWATELNWEKSVNFATKVRYPLSDSGGVPAVSTHIPQNLGSLVTPTEKTWWNRRLDVGLPFPVSVGDIRTVTTSWEVAAEKWPESKHFKRCVSLSTQNTGKVLFLQGRKGINRECVFRPLSIRNCLDSKKRDLQSPQRTKIPVRAVSFLALFMPCKHIPRSSQDCPCANRLQECVWEYWVPSCAYLDKVICHWKWAND